MAESYYYEKYDYETGKVIRCPQDDKDRSVTGKFVLDVPKYFDENPAERKRLGWIKHITHDTDDIDYDLQTQGLFPGLRQIDEYTIEDTYTVYDKSEDQLAFEEMLSVAMPSIGGGGFFFF